MWNIQFHASACRTISLIGTCRQKQSNMDLNKLNKIISEWNNDSKDAFLKECVSRFGSMTKNDYEVALFHLLMKNEFVNNESDFSISVKLQIPESNVKRLRYEMNLLYMYDETKLDAKLLEMMKQGDFKLATDRIQFCINDKILRLYLNNKLLEGKRFADSSFNSNIVSVTAEDLLFLLDNNGLDEEKRKLIIESIKDKLKASMVGLPLNSREKILKYGTAILKIIGRPLLDSVVDVAVNDLEDYFKQNKEK